MSRDPARVFERHPELANAPELTFVRGDVGSFAFPDGTFSHLIHAATDTNVRSHRPGADSLSSISLGTARVLDFAAHADVTNMLLTSSGAVYGPLPFEGSGVRETFPLPDDGDATDVTYAAGKRSAERLCRTAVNSSLQVTIARCFAFVGPYLPLDAHYAIGNFIGNAVRREPIVIAGDGLSVRSYLYAADLSAWLWIMLVRGMGATYNVGSDRAFSIRDVAHTVASAIEPELTIEIRGANDPIDKRTAYVPNIDRARNALGLDAWTALPDAVAKTAAWARSALS